MKIASEKQRQYAKGSEGPAHTAVHRYRAFTLLELLIVIAIICLLAGLLLPVLGRGKTSAKRMTCVNNLRQLSFAAHMYWDDNNGNCFRYGGTAKNGGQLYWFGWIGPGSEGTRAFEAQPGTLYPYLPAQSTDACPALNDFLSRFKLKATGPTVGFGYNLFLSAMPPAPPIKSSRIVNTPETALFADAAQINTWQAPASPQNPMLEEWYYIDDSSEHPNGHFRHTERANVVFCDGHVGPEKWVAGSLDAKLPSQCVGRLRSEILVLPH